MKVLGIVCSPRAHGNTEILMTEVLNSAKDAGAEVELLTLAGKTITPCDGCLSCEQSGKCKIKDDMQDVYTKLLEADALIFGAPVYVWDVCAQAKILMDRTYCLMFSKDGNRLRDKIAAAVVVGTRTGHINAASTLLGYFNISRMITAGTIAGFGSAKGEIKNDNQAMNSAKALGRVVVRYTKRWAQGKTG